MAMMASSGFRIIRLKGLHSAIVLPGLGLRKRASHFNILPVFTRRLKETLPILRTLLKRRILLRVTANTTIY